MGEMIFTYKRNNVVAYCFDNDGIYNILLHNKVLLEDGKSIIKKFTLQRYDIDDIMICLEQVRNFIKENDK